MAIDKQTQKLILYAAIGGGTYFLILKPLLIKLGILIKYLGNNQWI